MKTPIVQLVVQISPGAVFRKGELFLGMDVASRLDAVCGEGHSESG
jgi:hypothetical protein